MLFKYLLLLRFMYRLPGRWNLFILDNAWNATAAECMRHEIGTLLLSFLVCTHDNAGNIICHDISGVDND